MDHGKRQRMFRTLEISDPALTPPGLRFVTVKSAALGQRADLLLYVPPQAASLRDVPLVILLHGVYGSHWAWAFQGGAHLTAQRLIDDGAIAPMVLAMPSDGLWGDGSGYVAHGEQDFEGWIADEVPVAARAACNACSEASPLCIAGLSMGGFGALRLAGKYPRRFSAAAGHSSVTEARQLDRLLEETRVGWAAAPADTSVLAALLRAGSAEAPMPALRFDCGRDDPFIDANRQLHADLQAAGIAHDYAEYAGGHGWAYWAQHLEQTLRFFGQALQTRAPSP
jgi:enterochelin esterase-like enzyme